MSYVIKVSLCFFVERERIYIINKMASSPVKNSELTCYLVSTLETSAVFELKAAVGMHNHVNCRDRTRSVSSLTSLRTLFFLALMIVGVTKITALFTEIAYVKIDASGCDVLENS